MIRPLTSLAILCVLAAAAVADEQPAFTSLVACRLDAERIVLHYAFDGGACQAVGEITAAEPRGTIAAVTIPTTDTSEMCTMQIVTIEGSTVLNLPEPVFDLDVEALYPDNRVQAAGLIELDEDGECVEPAE
jgi:hypothetical protein